MCLHMHINLCAYMLIHTYILLTSLNWDFYSTYQTLFRLFIFNTYFLSSFSFSPISLPELQNES